MFDKDKYQQSFNISTSQEELYLDMYLSFAETYLKRHGLTLVSEEETEETVSRFSFSQTIYRLPYRISQANITEVKAKNHNKEWETITDYTLFRRVDTDIRSYAELEFDKNYLEITVKGFFGFAKKLPPDLEFVFLNIFGNLLSLIRRQAEMIQNNGKDLSSLKIDEITYNFTANRQAKITELRAILDSSPDLKNILLSYV